MHGTDMKIVQE